MNAQHEATISTEAGEVTLQIKPLAPEYADAWCESLAAAAAWRPEAFAMDDGTMQQARRYFFTA